MIRFQEITKNFKNKKVLKGISFEVKKGQLAALIGESGCGKTTTLKMINRLINPTSGQILINGTDIKNQDMIRLRRQMGYVIQQTGLFPHMTIKENIEIIPKVEGIEKAAMEKRTCELMDMVGLSASEYLNRYPTELSGGQQQRIGVARAFAMDPEIILMDEPFSALDPITRSNLQDELLSWQSQFKKTIVFVTHDMDEAIRIADMICIMKDGEILQYDTPENILKNPVNDFVSDFVGHNRIWTSPEYIRARDIMISMPVTCSPNLSLLRCLEKMRTSKVDSLMVVRPKTNELLGIIRAKDIRNTADRSIEVSNLMTVDFLSVGPEDNIVDVLKMVDENNVSNIPVVDSDKTLLGLITKSSLVMTLSRQFLDNEEVNI